MKKDTKIIVVSVSTFALVALLLGAMSLGLFRGTSLNVSVERGDDYYTQIKNELPDEAQHLYKEDDVYYAERLSHARAVRVDDFETVNESMPAVLYSYGMNYGLMTGDDNGNFKNNTEMLAETSQPEIDSLLASAEALVSNYYTFDYRNGFRNIKESLSYCLSPQFADKDSLDSDIQANINIQLISECRFLTDKSLLYIDDSGFYRIRGRMFTYIEHMENPAFSAEDGMKPGVWYYNDLELAFVKDTSKEGWKHADYCFTLFYNFTESRVLPDEDIEKYLF